MRIAHEVNRAGANWLVIDGATYGVYSTSTDAWIATFLRETGLIPATV